jgi:hypothetical protein
MPVDRHVLRVANRIGLVHTDDAVAAETALGAGLAPARWTRASDTLILHGRRVCRPKPLCDRCQVKLDCDYFRNLGAKTRQGRQSPQGRQAQQGAQVMTRQEFRTHVDQALAMIPDRFREAMQNIAIVVEDDPAPQTLRELDLEPPDTLLGLYQGTPAHRAPVVARQCAARQDHALSGPHRRRVERQRRRRHRDCRDAHP